MNNTNFKTYLSQLEDTLNEYFGKKAPQLPPNIKEVIVKIAPILTIISIIITIPAILVLFGLGGIATALAPMGGVQTLSAVPTIWLSTLLLIPVVILEIMAFKGLQDKQLVGWRYLYWSQLVSVVSNLIVFNIVGAIIGGAIGFYFLFQVKSYYK